jgi:hypothetical protein
MGQTQLDFEALTEQSDYSHTCTHTQQQPVHTRTIRQQPHIDETSFWATGSVWVAGSAWVAVMAPSETALPINSTRIVRNMAVLLMFERGSMPALLMLRRT